VDPLDVEPTLDIEPRRAGSMLSRSVRNSIASFLISPSMSPVPEYPSAFLGTAEVAGLIGALLDLEWVRNDPGVSDPVGDKSDFAFSNVSPIARSCRFARFSENSAATDNV
jgi:hypothetical protein